ncbi:GLPGLI family protein [Flavobacterium sp. MFBS3-15]|uniref:GLPGLI family protein n=1 Tax=Flavobacterium sp. MFBS3-15 TaxID=2989816 RepID=UPI002236ACFB|nr:GLPGLI family protein [Flavobacterium sp. MFBS3-15]MCW4469264.1 GLPGLI family protein [Flavobacterium sp. MFBS3-15]
MKQRQIVLILFFICSHSFAQVSEGTIHYRVVVGTDELFEKLDKEIRDQYIKEKESEKYILEFNKNEFVYYLVPGLSVNSDRVAREVVYYKNKDSLYSLRPVDDEDFGKLLIKESRDTQWQLHNETKMIGRYKCYKATAELVRDNGKYGVFRFPVIAWYAPEIPLPYGPLGYGGLPGLILELQERNVVYGAAAIDFKIDRKNSKLQKPSRKGRKLWTQEEYNANIQKLMEGVYKE